VGLFGRAKNWGWGDGEQRRSVEPQYYEVECPEGHPISGRRTEGYQAIRCPTCGSGVFILPMSPLPEPPEPKKKRDAAQADQAGPVDEGPIPLSDPIVDEPPEEEPEVEWLEPASEADVEAAEVESVSGADPVEAAVADLPAAERPTARTAQRRASPSKAASANRPKSATRPQSPSPIPPQRPTLKERIRRRRPLIVALSVIAMVGLTALWNYQRNRRAEARDAVRLGLAEGIDALDRGEFDRAYQLLAPAARGVRLLGGQISGAEEVRQAAQEAAIYVDLVPETLEEILDERARSVDAEWERTFERNYKGRAILIGAFVVETPAGGERFDLNYRILALGPDRPRVGRIDLDGFRIFELAEPEVGNFVLFGARLAAVEAESPDLWSFHLDPESGVTIRTMGAIEALGWDPVPIDRGADAAALFPDADPAERAFGRTVRPEAPRNAWNFSPPEDLRRITPARRAPRLIRVRYEPRAPQAGAGGLEQLEPEDVRRRLGGPPNSFARSASQGRTTEQWIYEGIRSTRYINFHRPNDRTQPARVHRTYSLP